MISCSGLNENSKTSLWKFFSSARRKFSVSIFNLLNTIDDRIKTRLFLTDSTEWIDSKAKEILVQMA